MMDKTNNTVKGDKMKNKEERTEETQKALEEKDAKWEDVHGLSRQDHQRFLLAPYTDFETNAEYVLYMRMMFAKKELVD